jgi:fatty-acyl-CoA synthase
MNLAAEDPVPAIPVPCTPGQASGGSPHGRDDLLWRPLTYTEIVRAALERYPEEIAFLHGARAWTYAETADMIARMERALARHGAGPGDAVAVLCGNCPEGWMAEQACIALGARLIPLRPLGGLGDQAFICEDAQVKVLVFESGMFEERAAGLKDVLPAVKMLGMGPNQLAPDLLAAAAAEPSARIQVLGHYDDVACQPYTGGTTGRPKGVMLPHRSLACNFWLEIAGHQWPARPRFLAVTPITHAAFLMIAPSLALGGTVVLHDQFDPGHFIDDVHDRRVTATFIVPSMLYALLDHPAFDPDKLSSLETVLYGAAAMSPARIARALECLGQIFVQTYAQTEAPNTAVALHKEDHDLARPHLLAASGKPLVGVQVEIHDPDEQKCPVGEVGEIVIRGPLVMDGYWRRPEETTAALRGGWLHTGDLARRDEAGYLYIVDRLKDLITTGGVHVYPREIEDLLGTHPAVATAAVIGVPDKTLGEAVKAVVVRRPGTEVSTEELIAFVMQNKGPADAPASVDFVASIPLTGLGKPDKKLLRAQYQEDLSDSVH